MLILLHACMINLTCLIDVTIVQYRDKHNDTGALIKTARELKNLTQKYGVPLIINDRVDVAVAIEADGVHLGQDDMGELSMKGRS